MEQGKHTPGPWRSARPGYQLRGKYAGCWAVGPDTGPPCIYLPPGRDDVQAANAALVAAAPELLQAVRQALAYLPALAEHLEASDMPGHAGNVTIHIRRLGAALAAAEGRP